MSYFFVNPQRAKDDNLLGKLAEHHVVPFVYPEVESSKNLTNREAGIFVDTKLLAAYLERLQNEKKRLEQKDQTAKQRLKRIGAITELVATVQAQEKIGGIQYGVLIFQLNLLVRTTVGKNSKIHNKTQKEIMLLIHLVYKDLVAEKFRQVNRGYHNPNASLAASKFSLWKSRKASEHAAVVPATSLSVKL